MKIKTFKALFLALGFVISGQMRADTFKDETIAAGVVAAGALGCYLLYSWITHKTDQQVVDDGQRLAQKTDVLYAQLQALSVHHAEYAVEYNQEGLTAFLEEVSTRCIASIGYDSYMRRLRDMVDELSYSLQEGKKRIEKLKNDPEQQQLLERAGVVFELVQKHHDSLRAIMDFMKKHAGYFQLKDVYLQMHKHYARVLTIAYQLPSNPYLIDALAHEIQYNKQFEHSQYLYLDFYACLSKDCKQFAAILNSLSRHYGNVQEDAVALYTWLDFLARSVASSSRIALERYYKQSALIDKEMETLKKKHRDLSEAHSRAVTQRDIIMQRQLCYELEAVAKRMGELAVKRKQLDENRTQGVSNSFAYEYRNAL